MQIGIDLGATKIESVVLDDNGKEIGRAREKSPENYEKTLASIKLIIESLEKKFNKSFNIGVCHPGSISNETGLLKNAHNSPWLNHKPFGSDISKILDRNILCENDANCFALSEAFDGSAKNYKIVFGIILGSGCGGGLIVNKKIVKGANAITGEWGHNGLPFSGLLDDEIKNNKTIEDYVSGKGLEKLFKEKFNEELTTKEIFSKINDKDYKYKKFIDDFANRLARSLTTIINIADPDAIVFGGGVSNEIFFLDEIKKQTKKFLKEKEINTAFLKPMYGDASGVRGAAILGRKIVY
jgi:fructokinase